MDPTSCLLIALGGAIGTLARYGLSVAMMPLSQTLPWGTIAINVLGSFVIGYFGTLTVAHGRFPLSEPLRLCVMVGLCGGFTTFSSFSLQTIDLLRSRFLLRAIVNVVVSVVLCLVAVSLGIHFAGGRTEAAQLTAGEDA